MADDTNNTSGARNVTGLDTDFCLCGRFAWRVHCPHCGSYHTYSYTRKDIVTRAGGTVAHLTVYRCRRCASTFNDDDWKLRCSAPNVALTTRAGRKSADEVAPTKFESEEQIPEPMRNALELLKKQRGIK
jgi:DNA-directed RNA polymerase subunit RPC12/RpoP